MTFVDRFSPKPSFGPPSSQQHTVFVSFTILHGPSPPLHHPSLSLIPLTPPPLHFSLLSLLFFARLCESWVPTRPGRSAEIDRIGQIVVAPMPKPERCFALVIAVTIMTGISMARIHLANLSKGFEAADSASRYRAGTDRPIQLDPFH